MEKPPLRSRWWFQLLAAAGVGFVVLASAVASSEVEERRLEPRGRFATLAEFRRVLGDREFKWYRFEVSGAIYYEATTLQTAWVPPSGPTCYVFDGHGRFVDWTIDESNFPEFRRKWAPAAISETRIAEIEAEIGRSPK